MKSKLRIDVDDKIHVKLNLWESQQFWQDIELMARSLGWIFKIVFSSSMRKKSGLWNQA